MMSANLTAKATSTIDSKSDQVWKALVTPVAIKEYMFGADVSSQWKKGSKITWTGEVEGKKYEDKGEIVDIEPKRTLEYTHFSSLSGKPDKPENYHTVRIHLEDQGSKTHVTLTQDNNPTEKAQGESQKNWAMMLKGLKKYVESQATT
jgi:uncharacterized protein YndB with AHSA1/START domain